MSIAKANGLIKYLAIGLGVLLIFIFVKVFGSKNDANTSNNTAQDEFAYDLTKEEAKAFGITAGDTPHDTLKTLLAETRKTKAEVEKANRKNEQLSRENEALRNREVNVENRIEKAIEEKTKTIVDDLTSKFANLQSEYQSKLNEIPIGNTPPEFKIGGAYPAGSGAMRWVEPEDSQITDAQGNIVSDSFTGTKKTGFPSLFKALDDSALGKAATSLHHKPNQNSANDANNAITPYFTIPENSTLMGAVAMTALLGRIPIDGTVTDPYPFKVLLGKDNLIANGIELPDVEGAIVSWTTSGDWTLSCVRGKVQSISFIFSDGRISNGKVNNKTRNSNNDKGIGWFSNPEGVTCVPGERKTNAPEYLTSQFFLAGASAAAQSFAQGQTTTVVQDGSVIGAVTGNQGKYVLGQAIGGGLKETQDWFAKRYGQTFDAVYVPPGQPLAIHITEELDIDYDANARKVKYSQTNRKAKMD